MRLRDAVVWGYMMQRNARRGQVSVLTGAIMRGALRQLLQGCRLVEAVVSLCTCTQQDCGAFVHSKVVVRFYTARLQGMPLPDLAALPHRLQVSQKGCPRPIHLHPTHRCS